MPDRNEQEAMEQTGFVDGRSLDQSLSQGRCHCQSFKTAWALAKRNRDTVPHPTRLTAYLRIDGGPDKTQQYIEIKRFCDEHGFEIGEVFEDYGLPALGMHDALDSLDHSDGIIASDLNRFVEHENDRMRDLKPLLHRFFCSGGKHLIAVEEGIDTANPEGQKAAVEFMSQVKGL